MKTKDELTVADKYQLEKLKDMIQSGKVHDGIPRVHVSKNKDGTYTAHLDGFTSQTGPTVIDALSIMHDSLLTYYERLQNTPLGEHGRNQLRVLQSFLALRTCDCQQSPDTYCYCRGFERS